MASVTGRHWLDPPDWWARWKPLRWIALAFVGIGVYSWLDIGKHAVVAILAAPHPETELYTRVEPDRVSLLGVFRSYDSIAAITTQLERDSFVWTVSARHAPPSSDYPPYNIDVVTVEEFKHKGVLGELTLEFFNDRLYEGMFVPKVPEDYVAVLREMGLRPSGRQNARAEVREGHLRVASTVELAISEVGRSIGTKPYALWQDMRLIRSRDAWDKSYIMPPPVPQ